MIRIRHNDINSVAALWADGLVDFLTEDKMAFYENLFFQLCSNPDYNTIANDINCLLSTYDAADE